MKRKILKWWLCALFLLTSIITYGQDLPEPGGGGGHPELPIDGGISFLLIAGVIFGVYKLKEKK